ncbi:MAG: hypothetical protein FGM57_01710 [Candidatus Taylorbacteria bacterium]|nr:hypothetical protein [Candidatus Taylorbacteria bacterium]
MPDSIYHTISSIIAALMLYAFYTHSFMLLSACLIWYGIGIYAANSHLNWCKNAGKHVEHPWRFFCWFSFNGVILLIATKTYEMWHSKTQNQLTE